MLKKYISKSDIALSVLLKTNKSVHVAFSPLTGGGSVLYTDDADLQWALERHPKYGRLFKLDIVRDEVAEGSEPLLREELPTEGLSAPSNGAGGGPEDLALKQIHVDSLDDAKEYLCDHFGVSRTKLRTRKSIMDSGVSNGVEFVVSNT